MTRKYEMVAYYYKAGFWGIDKVRNAVGKFITEEEFKKITGKKYDAEDGE